MTIDARQAHFFVDRLCGGHGPVTGNEDVIEFKEIGQSLVKRVALYLLDDLERAWEPIFPLKTMFKSLHFNPNYFEAVAPSGFQGGGVGVISMEVKSEHSQGKLNLCFSRSTLQQLLGNGGKKDAEEPPHVEKALTERLKKCLSEVSVNVSVELGKGTLTFREFLSLKEGDVIHLDNGTTKEVLLRIEGIDKFRGNPGRYLNQRAIKIVSPLKNGGQ
jgi:flagellar motor switch protein FliM